MYSLSSTLVEEEHHAVEDGVTSTSIIHVPNMSLVVMHVLLRFIGSNRTPDRLQLQSKSAPPAVRLGWGKIG